MSGIKRFSLDMQFAKSQVKHDSEGELCFYRDYAALQQKLDAVLASLEAEPVWYIHKHVWREYKQALIARCEKHLEWRKKLGFTGIAEEECAGIFAIALEALTQPASQALNLPDGWVAVPVEPNWEMLSADCCKEHHNGQTCLHHDNRRSIWAAMLAAAPAPHTAPIDPICATGGAEWVKVSERMPGFDIDVMVYCADTEEQFVAYHRNDGVFHYATYTKGNAYVNIVCEPTHWMPLPAAPEEK